MHGSFVPGESCRVWFAQVRAVSWSEAVVLGLPHSRGVVNSAVTILGSVCDLSSLLSVGLAAI
jgi:hypothetical protein